MGELWLGALGDVPVGSQQRRGVSKEKSGVGSQVFLEIVVAASEAGGRADGVHLGADPFHFGKPDRVNLLRRVVRRDMPLDVVGVHRGAMRQGGGLLLPIELFSRTTACSESR